MQMYFGLSQRTAKLAKTLNFLEIRFLLSCNPQFASEFNFVSATHAGLHRVAQFHFAPLQLSRVIACVWIAQCLRFFVDRRASAWWGVRRCALPNRIALAFFRTINPTGTSKCYLGQLLSTLACYAAHCPFTHCICLQIKKISINNRKIPRAIILAGAVSRCGFRTQASACRRVGQSIRADPRHIVARSYNIYRCRQN